MKMALPRWSSAIPAQEPWPAGSNGGPLLTCRGVDVAYDKVQVLFGVDIDVAPGEIVALLGTNGAGKSTLLKAISGLVTPKGGRGPGPPEGRPHHVRRHRYLGREPRPHDAARHRAGPGRQGGLPDAD